MKKVIIGIHGLGNKPKPNLLEEWWWKSIQEGLSKYTDNHYKKPVFKLVYWADVLHPNPEDENCTDPENPLYIKERYEAETNISEKKESTFRKKVTDSILIQVNKIFLNDDYSLNFSALNDIIVKNYFEDLNAYYSNLKNEKGERVKVVLREKLKSVLLKHKNDDVLLIAHSMGSIISYDVLTLFSEQLKISTFITIGSPLGLPVVISKIAGELKLKSKKTEKLKTPDSIKKHWFNFSDLEDKVAFNYGLKDDFSENTSGIHISDFLVHNNYSSKGKSNPHKSYGYLRTPEIAASIYQFLNEKPRSVLKEIWNYGLNYIKKLFEK